MSGDTVPGWTHNVANSLGASESGLRLVLGQLAGYPLLLLYRRHIFNKDVNTQHLYFFLSGLLISYWVIGEGVTHSLYTIFSTYLVTLFLGGSISSVIVSFTLNMTYLLAGYWYVAKDEYDISWTMPQCVLCLRLIGLSWDLYDGARLKKNPECLSKDQLKTALSSSPNILEMLSHSFFIGGYFVGPQFSLAKYRQFVSPEYQSSLPSSPVSFGLKRLGISICYLTAHVVGSMFLPEDWPTKDGFFNTPFIAKLLLMPIWVKLILAKYLSMWLMAEGICAVSGLSYVGLKETDSGPQADWTGCANVKLRRLESAQKFGHYIEAFNINTNSWVMNYVYKRLKFMNNRYVSQLSALIFLAVWHGWHSGYYLTFFNEFIVINFEREWASVWAKSAKVSRWKEHPAYNTMTVVLGWIYCHFFLPHCFLPFALLFISKYMRAYTAVLYIEYIFFLGWHLWGQPVKMWLLSENSRDKKEKVDDKKAVVSDKREASKKEE